MRVLEMEAVDQRKTINGKIKVNFDYYSEDKSENNLGAAPESIGAHNSDGVLRVNILNGTCNK